ncbi:hypothetical protein C1T17_05730 [Sphingobium sp. SCG-1]|nr:hypothetical protein C1T17_05730 [Sphingobium sp. SCG-1]
MEQNIQIMVANLDQMTAPSTLASAMIAIFQFRPVLAPERWYARSRSENWELGGHLGCSTKSARRVGGGHVMREPDDGVPAVDGAVGPKLHVRRNDDDRVVSSRSDAVWIMLYGPRA